MIAVRLVRLIEQHSDELTDGLLIKFQSSSRTSELRKVPTQELRHRSHEVLRNLSDWLLSNLMVTLNGGTARLARCAPHRMCLWRMFAGELP